MSRRSPERRVFALVFSLLLVLSPAVAGVTIAGGADTGVLTTDATTTTTIAAAGNSVSLTGSVVRADGTSGGDTVGATRASLNSSGVGVTNATGNFSLGLDPNTTDNVLYVQGDFRNETGVMPRDGSPDVFALDRVSDLQTDTDLGETALPTGHLLDVFVNDTNGDPVEGVNVIVYHDNPATNTTVQWGGVTGADGRFYPFRDSNQSAEGTPGIEVNGQVRVVVLPPNFSQPITRNLTVSSDRSLNATVTAPASGNLTVENSPVAGFTPARFVAENETGLVGNETYYWEFGDGRSAESRGVNETTHTYRTPGTYTARLSVFENGSETPRYTDSVEVTVTPAGTADLVVEPTTANVSENVTMRVTNVSILVNGSVSFYSWWFDDGSGTSTQPPTNETVHAFAEPGNYTIQVTGYSDTEARFFTVQRDVTVEGDANEPPTADLAANRTEITAGEAVSLDASGSTDADGSVVEYRWDFDGDTATDRTTTSASVVHRYSAGGSYDATVTVVDDDGATADATATVSVRSAVESAGGAWPQFHFDAANTGYNASATGPTGPVETAWNVDNLNMDPLPPVVWNGMVLSSEDPRVRAFDAATGSTEWNTYLYPADYSYTDQGERFDITSAPTVVNGVAYVGAFWNDSSAETTYEIVYALDATTGAELWNVSRPAEWTGYFDDGIEVAEPKVVDGKVVVASAVSDSVYVLNATGDHEVLWSDDLKARHDSEVRASPAVSNGTVLVTQGWSGSARGYIYAFDLDNGTYLWDEYLGYNYEGAPPAIADGVAYVARDGDSTLAFGARNGTELWSGPDGYVGEYGSPAVTDDLVLVGKGPTAETASGLPGGIRALDRGTGDLVWTFNASGPVSGAPAVAGDRVYVATTDASVVALDLQTGTELWSYDIGDTTEYDGTSTPMPVHVAPAVADGTMYVRAGSNVVSDRAIYAITEATASGDFDADLVATPATVFTGETVTLSLANVTGETPDSYQWRFGDGTTTTTTDPDTHATHSYDAAGSYDASVSAYAADGSLLATRETTVTVERPTGDLVAEPTTADVNVTRVAFRLENVSGPTPFAYSWDLDGDGQFEDSTSHPNVTTNYTYAELLGTVSPRVVVYGDGERELFTAETLVDVVDRIPPVARANASDSRTGEPLTVNASNSTDNHRIASYTFESDEGETVTGPDPTADLTFATGGNHTVNVTVTDPSGNTNSTALTVFVRDAPDLTVNVSAPPTQELDNGATATVTVTNEGTDDATGVLVRLNTTARESYYSTTTTSFERSVGSLGPGESTSVTVDFTDWAEGNVSGVRPRVGLLATVDPGDTVVESDESNNVAENATDVGYSDVGTYVSVPYSTITEEQATVFVRFRNLGGLASPERTATVSFGDGSDNVTVTVPALESGEREVVTLNHTFAAGRNEVRVNVTDDPRERGNVDTDTTRTEAFDLSVSGPDPESVERNQTFYLSTIGRANYVADQNATIELPDGLELTDGYSRTVEIEADSYVRYYWEVRAVNESGTDPYAVNVTVRSRDQSVTKSADVEVIAPRLRVRNSSSVVLSGSDSGTTTLDVRDETTYDHSLTMSVQLGAQGRTLAGLDYLFSYPHGCVEQVTSPMLTALNTDKYYRANPAPNGYDEGKTDRAVAGGIEELTVGSDAQHDNGAWSMYGNDPDGDMYYTAYALFGTGSVANDPVQGARSGVAADLSNADLNETVFWFEENQETDGRLANDKYYFDDDDAMTGFALVALDRAGPYNASATDAADRVRANATEYLVASQNADGSWGDDESNAMSTALAVWGLARSGIDTPEVNDAIDAGVAWLVAAQGTDGEWTDARSGSWRATGTTSETTGYAVLALNATGVPATNTTVSAGTTYLVGTYDDQGSWGYTRASAVAIDALLTLGVGGANPSQSVTVEFGTAANPSLVTKSVTVDDATPQATVTLTDAELETLRDAGPPIQVTVTASGTGQLVIGLENDQLVNADEYVQDTGGD